MQAVTRRSAAVFIAKDGGTAVNARSILGVLSLDLRQGDVAVLTAEGEGAEETVGILAALLTA